MFDILKNGIFNSGDQNKIKHHDDKGVLKSLEEILKNENIKTVCDFGCGNGFYIKKLIDLGYFCEAYDGNPYTVELTKGIGKILDISIPFNLQKTFDCVISLEVGEHIPKESESVFINNLVSHAQKYLILSWAIPGQGGDAHVNEQGNDYIISKFTEKGFSFMGDYTTLMRQSADKWYFKNTLMVFKNENN
jgi:SAM-dependent methyltransferase